MYKEIKSYPQTRTQRQQLKRQFLVHHNTWEKHDLQLRRLHKFKDHILTVFFE
jgi:hypothetical protein